MVEGAGVPPASLRRRGPHSLYPLEPAESGTISYDPGKKLNAYRRNGVREYVVWRVLDRQVDWFVNREGRFEPMPPAADGILRSAVFPGLWLDPAALVRGDKARVKAVLQGGLDSPEHAAFVARLERAHTA